MDVGDLLAVLVATIPFWGIIPLAFWMHWKENRKGGITDRHVREIRKLSAALGRDPPSNLATMSWEQGVRAVKDLGFALDLKRKYDRRIPN